MAYNNSRIKMFRRCQKQYSFRYDLAAPLELVPRAPKTALRLGSWMHELQAAWHYELAAKDFEISGVPTWEERHEELVDEFNGLFDEEKAEYGDLPGEALRLFRSYLRFCASNGDHARYTTAALRDGGGPAIEFVVEVPLDRYGINAPFKGRIDRLVEDREYGGLWIWDAKWVRSIPNPDDRMMSPQACLYVWAMRKLGYDVRGFVFNYGRKKAPTEPRVLVNGTLSVAKRMDSDYYTYLKAIKRQHGAEYKEWIKHYYIDKLRELKRRDATWFRRERIPVEQARIKQALTEFLVSIKDIERRNTKHPPRTYQYDCPRQCDYHDLCVAQFQGLDILPLIQRRYTTEEERYAEEEIDAF